jgi:hypothetical protein
MVRGVMRKVALQALQGNLSAARILLDRTLGRVTEAPAGEPLDIEPLRLRTASDCGSALQRVACRFRKLWHRPFRKLWHSVGEEAPAFVTIS